MKKLIAKIAGLAILPGLAGYFLIQSQHHLSLIGAVYAIVSGILFGTVGILLILVLL